MTPIATSVCGWALTYSANVDSIVLAEMATATMAGSIEPWLGSKAENSLRALAASLFLPSKLIKNSGMKIFTLAVLVAALFSAPAMAQQAPAPQGPPPTPNAQMHQHFEAMHKQMEQLHRDARSQMLAALSPANRTLLATLAGQLAVAANPDYDAAAKKLDAALSASEKTAIDTASQHLFDKMKANMQSMQSMHSQGTMGGQQNGMHGGMMQSGKMHGDMMGDHMNSMQKMSAGAKLLQMATSLGAMNMMFVTHP